MKLAAKVTVAVVVFFVLSLVMAAVLHAALDKDAPQAAQTLKAQETCPIMGGKINKGLYANVNGYRIYVCCGGCIGKIKADPDAALKTLAARGKEPIRIPADAKDAPMKMAGGMAGCGMMGGDKSGKGMEGMAGCTMGGMGGGKGMGGMTAKAAAEKRAVAEVSTETLQTLLASGVATIVDARPAKIDDGRRIPGAKSLNPMSTPEEIAKVLKSKDALIVTYCANTKCPASRKVAARLSELGYKHLLVYPVGIDGWVEAGQKIAKVEPLK